MEELLLFLNQTVVLWSLFAGAIILVLIDYLFPVDWPAYLGYVLFAIFIGATVPLSVAFSFLSMLAVFSLMLTLHKAVFSKFLTNAPHLERARLAGFNVAPTDSPTIHPSQSVATDNQVETTGDNDVLR